MHAVVIGAGLAGLLAARTLTSGGASVVVLEAGNRPGGMLAAAELGGVRVDAGAEAWSARSDAARRLCAELDLPSTGPAGRAHVWWKDAIVPLADGLLGIPASLEDPALDILTDDERARLAQDLELPAEVGADATTAGELMAARMGEAAVVKLMAPLTQGAYRAHPMELPLAVFAPQLLEALTNEGSLLAAVASLQIHEPSVLQPIGGMFRLAEELARGLDVRLATPATSLHRDGAGFVVGTPGEPIHADRVVLATGAAVARQLLAEIGVAVPEAPSSPTQVVLLASDHPGLDAHPVGSGLLMGDRDPAVVARGLAHYSAKWPWVEGCHILRLNYAGDTPALRAVAVEDASRLTKLDLTEHVIGFVAVTHQMPGKLTPQVRDDILAATAAAGVDVVGAWLDGNGIGPVMEGVERLS